MKKFFVGIIVGVILSMAVPAMAESILGKPVEGTFPVYLLGEKLSKDAIVINSTSYLPVRAVSEALGYQVRFENNQVLLERKQDNTGNKTLHYKINSNVLPIRNESPDIPSFEKDGEIYISTSVLEKNYAENLYEEGRLHRFSGRMFIKISDFGLKAVIRDGVMWLE